MPRRGFTLVELMVTITIIAMLAGMLMGALFASQQQAREARTRSLISRLDQSVMARWESYRTRRVPLNTAGLDPSNVAPLRLAALRELMRLELPQRFEDITADPNLHPAAPPPDLAMLTDPPALSDAYRRRFNAAARYDAQYQGAECLYMIITMGVVDDDPLARDSFGGRDVGDRDEDGLPEFHDGWGQPISFLRWAPGFISDLQPDPTLPDMLTFARDRHDPFDPLKVDPPTGYTGPPPRGYWLKPLVYSAGRDSIQDIWSATGTAGLGTATARAQALGDPYYLPAAPNTIQRSGDPYDSDGDGLNHLDNIHNHILQTRLQ